MTPVLSDRAASWLQSVFSAKAAQKGAIVRRSVRDVEALIHRDIFLAEVRRRGFTAVENGGQFVIFCNREPLYRLV